MRKKSKMEKKAEKKLPIQLPPETRDNRSFLLESFFSKMVLPVNPNHDEPRRKRLESKQKKRELRRLKKGFQVVFDDSR